MNQSTILASNTSFIKSVCFAVLLVISSLRAGEGDTPAKDTDVGRRKIIWGDPIEVYKKPALEVFGKRELPVVNSGFLFVDGEYIDLPYRISQRGNVVYVNERRILKYIWPPTVFCCHREMPKIPARIAEKAHRVWELKLDEVTIRTYGFDPEYNLPSDYDDLLLWWCSFFYMPRTAARIYAEQLQKLPFVKRSELLSEPAVGIRLHYSDGFSIGNQNVNPDNRPTRTVYGSDAIIKRMNKTMNHLIMELKAGNIVFWESRDKSKSTVDANQRIWHLGGARPKRVFLYGKSAYIHLK